MFRRVVVGISGGVDSAVAAYLLKSKGFEVHGAFMKNWDLLDETGQCSSVQDLEDADYVCRKLDIPLMQLNYVKDYWNNVFGSFLKDYENGLTPNPDILCNKYVKFNAFFKHAIDNLGWDAIATGHYANTSFGSFLEGYREDARVRLLTAADTFKDQTFFLSQVPQEALRRTMFPLGKLVKHQVKEIASVIGLERIAKKRESTGICFIGRRSFPSFISEYIDMKKGPFVDYDTGQTIGEHNGIQNWTVGQGISVGGCLKPYFVLRKETTGNVIYVVAGTDHPALFTDVFYTNAPFWINPINTDRFILNCEFRFQHTKPLTNAQVIHTNLEKLLVKLAQPLRAITPGQYAVFYKGNECLGSARILQPGPSMKYSSDKIS